LRRTIVAWMIILTSITACQGGPATEVAEPAEIDGGDAAGDATALTRPATPTPAPTVPGSILSLLPKQKTATPTQLLPTPIPSTPIPTSSATPVPSPTSIIPAMPIPTPPSPLIEFYQVQPGDTLGGISYAYDISIAELVALNDLESEAAIIQVGQTLHVPLRVSRSGPLLILLPDSEVVFSPAYVDYDLAAFLAEQGGYLAHYSERVNGQALSGAEIINRVARQYSLGPRLLLALLEFYGGWVTQPQPEAVHPLGPANPHGQNLFLQLSWTANRLNEGYYGYKQSGSIAIRFRDRSRALLPPGMNAGTAALQNLLAAHTDWDTWLVQLQPDGFMQTYIALFGDPFALAVEPLVPQGLTQPTLALPWETGQTFYLSGGPHPAYGEGSGWAAVDFGPPDVLGSCYYSAQPLTAAAAGRVILGRPGEMYLDLDGDGRLQTGWVLLYLHAVAVEGLTNGQPVSAGTPLGYASCEGGPSNASHLHFARRYNGEWLAAAGPVPLELSGWRVEAGLGPYEGDMVREGEVKTACECWDEKNALLGE